MPQALLLVAQETAGQAPGAPQRLVRSVAEGLVKLQDAWDNPDGTAEWRAKLLATSQPVSQPAPGPTSTPGPTGNRSSQR